MKQLEKEITETNKQGMMKRYQMYGMKVSKLTGDAIIVGQNGYR